MASIRSGGAEHAILIVISCYKIKTILLSTSAAKPRKKG